MKSNHGQKRIIRMVILLLMMLFFLGISWVWGVRKEWTRFSICLATYIIFAVWLAFMDLSSKIVERLDRLEELLRQKRETSSVAQDSSSKT